MSNQAVPFRNKAIDKWFSICNQERRGKISAKGLAIHTNIHNCRFKMKTDGHIGDRMECNCTCSKPWE